jgi:hypothetical protein
LYLAGATEDTSYNTGGLGFETGDITEEEVAQNGATDRNQG